MASPKSMSLSQLLAYKKQLAADGRTEGNSKEAAKVANLINNHPSYQLYKSISKVIQEYEAKLDTLEASLALTDDEKQAFLDKAIQEITPYFERKQAEIEAGIQEGLVRSAEDTILFLQEVDQETRDQLSMYDIEQAQTEEEFINQMSFITSREEDDIGSKQFEWKERLENTKMEQVAGGTFSSGVAQQRRNELEGRKQAELSEIAKRAQEQRISQETSKKYDLDRIALARQSVQERRMREIGSPDEFSSTMGAARDTLGLGEGQQLGSRAEIERQRSLAGRNIDIYKPGALTDLEEQRRTALESRKGELEANELAIREQREKRLRQQIEAQLASQRSNLARIA